MNRNIFLLNSYINLTFYCVRLLQVCYKSIIFLKKTSKWLTYRSLHERDFVYIRNLYSLSKLLWWIRRGSFKSCELFIIKSIKCIVKSVKSWLSVQRVRFDSDRVNSFANAQWRTFSSSDAFLSCLNFDRF